MDDTTTPLVNGPAGAPKRRRLTQPPRILVADSEIASCQLSLEALTASGYQVDAAPDGATAWSALTARRYQLLIADNNLRKVSTVDLLRRLETMGKPVPVILATATVPMETFARAPRLLPEAFLLKPFALPELLALVQRMLGPSIGSGGQTRRVPNPRPTAIAIRWLEAEMESIPIRHRPPDWGRGAW